MHLDRDNGNEASEASFSVRSRESGDDCVVSPTAPNSDSDGDAAGGWWGVFDDERAAAMLRTAPLRTLAQGGPGSVSGEGGAGGEFGEGGNAYFEGAIVAWRRVTAQAERAAGAHGRRNRGRHDGRGKPDCAEAGGGTAAGWEIGREERMAGSLNALGWTKLGLSLPSLLPGALAQQAAARAPRNSGNRGIGFGGFSFSFGGGGGGGTSSAPVILTPPIGHNLVVALGRRDGLNGFLYATPPPPLSSHITGAWLRSVFACFCLRLPPSDASLLITRPYYCHGRVCHGRRYKLWQRGRPVMDHAAGSLHASAVRAAQRRDASPS